MVCKCICGDFERVIFLFLLNMKKWYYNSILKLAVCGGLLFITGTCSGQQLQVIPNNALISDSLKKEIAKGSINLTALKEKMEYQISARGFETVSLKFINTGAGIQFPEGLSKCDPCIVELKDSPLVDGIEKSASLKLRKKPVERRQTILLGILPARVLLPDDEVVAKVNGKKLKMSSDDLHITFGYLQNFAHPIAQGLHNSYLMPYDINLEKPDLTRMYEAKVIVRPVIKKVQYRLSGKLLRNYFGPMSLSCEWQFFYTSDTSKILGSITTETSMIRVPGILDVPGHHLIFEASRDLSAIDTLFGFLSKLERDFMLNSFSNSTKLTKVPEVVFPNQKSMLTSMSDVVVTVQHEKGFGSGVLVDPSGIVLTNHHVVIDDTSELMIRLNNSEELIPAKVKVLNTDYDLALLELPPGKYKSVSLFSRDTLGVGDVVYAIGTPLDKSLSQSVTKGIVSASRWINGINFIQTDVSMNSGNSGGALFSEDGKLMGISTMKASGRGIEGLGFCIPSYVIEQALQLKY